MPTTTDQVAFIQGMRELAEVGLFKAPLHRCNAFLDLAIMEVKNAFGSQMLKKIWLLEEEGDLAL